MKNVPTSVRPQDAWILFRLKAVVIAKKYNLNKVNFKLGREMKNMSVMFMIMFIVAHL